MKEKLKSMLNAQKEYNQLIFEKYECNYDKFTIENIRFALFDKLGELNHLFKSEWCWYKDSGYYGKATKNDILIAYTDCVCFMLTLVLMMKGTIHSITELCRDIENNYTKGSYYIGTSTLLYTLECMEYAQCHDEVSYIFVSLLFLGYKLGFSFDDIYKAYNDRIEYYTYNLKLESGE